jgi:hypothetical protein
MKGRLLPSDGGQINSMYFNLKLQAIYKFILAIVVGEWAF